MPTLAQLWTYLHSSESATSAFFATGAQCAAAVTGLSAALATFHYQNLLGRIRETRDRLFEKYDKTSAGLRQELQDRYRGLRTIESHVDFWREYYQKEDKGGHHLLAFDDLHEMIKQTKRFRFMVIRVTFYGFAVLLPIGLVGTLAPNFIPPVLVAVAEVAYLGLCLFYFAMNLALTRSVFINPWPKK